MKINKLDESIKNVPETGSYDAEVPFELAMDKKLSDEKLSMVDEDGKILDATRREKKPFLGAEKQPVPAKPVVEDTSNNQVDESLSEAANVADQVIISTHEDGFISKMHELREKGYKTIWTGDGKICMARPIEMKEEAKFTEDNPFANLRSNMFEFPSGDYKYVGYDNGMMYAGGATNNGIFHEVELPYDPDDSVDGNLQRLYNEIVEQNPEFDIEIESCEESCNEECCDEECCNEEVVEEEYSFEEGCTQQQKIEMVEQAMKECGFDEDLDLFEDELYGCSANGCSEDDVFNKYLSRCNQCSREESCQNC